MKQSQSLWTEYDVSWRFATKLCGSTPGRADIVKPWLDARKPKARPPGGKSIEETQEEVMATLAEPEPEFSSTIFQRQNGGLVVRGHTVRAHLKECARVLSWHYIGRVQGERSLQTKVKNCLYPDEYWIPILRPDGEPIKNPDGEIDKPIHVTGPRGEVSALKRFEFIEPSRIDFTLRVLGGAVKHSDLEHMMTYGGTHGYGGERSAGEGKYLYTITERKNGNGKT